VRDSVNRLAAVPWKPIDDATSYLGEQGARSLTAAPLQYGIWGKSHLILIGPYKHASLRIVPRNQHKWLNHLVWGGQDGVLKRNFQILADAAYFTIGGGPTNLPCFGYINAGINRDRDFRAPAVDIELLPLLVSQEDVAMERHCRLRLLTGRIHRRLQLEFISARPFDRFRTAAPTVSISDVWDIICIPWLVQADSSPVLGVQP
jgi:hypothetical protein